uniref:Uncharacterized protein n=1 Tax=Ciona intestinalis TaxID=7719 RepID=H2XPA1_CIOIN
IKLQHTNRYILNIWHLHASRSKNKLQLKHSVLIRIQTIALKVKPISITATLKHLNWLQNDACCTFYTFDQICPH